MLNEACVAYEKGLHAILAHATGECLHTADEHMACFTSIEKLARAALSTDEKGEAP